MLRRRLHRLSTAFFVVMSLLMSQLAMANYVCPALAGGPVMAAMMAAGQPCDGMDQRQPALCHEHAAAPAQAFEVVKLPVLGPPAVVLVLVRPSVIPDAQGLAVPPTASVEGQPPPEPLFLATLRLRV